MKESVCSPPRPPWLPISSSNAATVPSAIERAVDDQISGVGKLGQASHLPRPHVYRRLASQARAA